MFERLRSIIRAASRSRRPEPLGTLGYVRTPAGVVMHAQEALKLSAVWACINVIAKSIASSDWDIFEQDDDGNRLPRRSTRQWWLLNTRPNPEMSAFAFREAMLTQALLHGNSYAEVERNNRGEAMHLWPLETHAASLVRSRDTGELLLQVSEGQGGRVFLPYRDVYHLHGPSVNGVEGLDVVAYAARTFGHSAAAEIFGSSFYGNGTEVGGVLSTDQKLTPDLARTLRESVNERHGGARNAHRFLVLHSGMKYAPLTPTPEAAQFVSTRQFLVDEVCRWYGVPPHKVQHLHNATLNNVEHLGLEFVRDALTPWAERMAQEADGKLMPFGNRMLRSAIDLEWLTYGDAQSRASADAALVGAGVITRNEARRRRGLNAIPHADELTVQMQYIPLGSEAAEKPAVTDEDADGFDDAGQEAEDEEAGPDARL